MKFMSCGKSESSGMLSPQKSIKMKEQMSKKLLILWSLYGLFTIVSSSSVPQNNQLVNKDDGNSVKKGINDSSRKFDGLLSQRQFSSTKERPELNLVLSELINADVKKSIESTRNVDLLLPPPVPTTYRPSLTTDRNSLSALVNDGLVDQSIELDEAGSDNKQQTSRIQIKKGSNGVDYEYEYVYYYYDDDEKEERLMDNNGNHRRGGGGGSEKKERLIKSTPSSTMQSSSSVAINNNNNNDGSDSVSRNGKDRVGNYEVYEDTSDKRLPLNTRFPPRNANVTPAYISSDVDETTKKILVKRPSLELVDSQSFNRDDKGGGKGSKLIENEFRMVLAQSTIATTSVGTSSTPLSSTSTTTTTTITTNSIHDSEELSTESIDITTTPPPFMEKLAIDLYAILANENLSIDTTTSGSLGINEDNLNGDVTITTDQDGQTTLIPIVKTISTVITTSTTLAPPSTSIATTTTTTTEATTTPRVITTEATVSINNRKSPFKSGRNRFQHNKQDNSAEKIKPTIAVTSETGADVKKPNRFSRPSSSSFGRGGNNKRTSTQSPQSSAEEVKEIKKDSFSPVQRGSSSGVGRTRNRFNVNGAAAPATVQSDENSNNGTTLSQSNKHHRLSYQVRSHVKPTTVSTVNEQQINISESNSSLSSGESIKNDKNNNNNNNNNSLPRSSRFNLGRPNRLLANRNRGIKPQLPENADSSSNVAAGQSSEQEDSVLSGGSSSSSSSSSQQDSNNGEQSSPVIENTKTPSTPLNRLKTRSRLQSNQHNLGPTATTTTTNRSKETTNIRKINPLISRRKMGISLTTAEPSSHEEENLATPNETTATKNDDNENSTEPIEVSSEQSPPVLGLIGSRRRLQIRKPGTIL